MTRESVKFSFFAFTLLIGSCAGNYRSESIQEKMGRYEAKDLDSNLVPELPLMSYDFPGTQMHKRTLSSLNKKTPNSTKKVFEDGQEFGPYSHKRIYFLALLSQYYTLKTYLGGESPEIVHCPQFHSVKLDFKKEMETVKKNEKKITLSTALYDLSVKDESIMPLFPELSLPLTTDTLHPTVYENIKQKSGTFETMPVLQKALGLHLEKNYTEIKRLCEIGQSDTYFAFENLITYMQTHQDFSESRKGLEALFKTTIVSNMAIINSLKLQDDVGRKVASEGLYSKFEEEVLHRFQAHWLKDYFREMRKKRGQISQN